MKGTVKAVGSRGLFPINGFWVHSGQLWWANEDTVLRKDHVDRRSIKELLNR